MHQRKPIYPIGDKLRAYMRQHDRELELPIAYEDLLRYDGLLPVLDDNGNETLWNTVLLRQGDLSGSDFGWAPHRSPDRREHFLLRLWEFSTIPDKDRECVEREP